MNWRRSRWKTIAFSTFDMRAVLHIVTTVGDTVAETVIGNHQSQADVAVTVVDLAAGEPDYAKLLEQIFAADLVAVW
jgi:hypothetical protein